MFPSTIQLRLTTHHEGHFVLHLQLMTNLIFNDIHIPQRRVFDQDHFGQSLKGTIACFL